MIFTSPHPAVPIPEGKTIWNMLELHARERGDKPAFVCGITDKVLTYAETLKKAEAICAGLAACGIKKGDVVILHSLNCVEYPVVFLALNRLGAICSPSPSMFSGKELAQQVKIAKATAVISHKMLAPAAVEAAQLGGIELQRVFIFGQGEGSFAAETLESLIAEDLPLNLPAMDPMDVVTLPFSSGTTGRPKGVELTGYAMLAMSAQLSAVEKGMPCYLGMLPFFHILTSLMFHATIFKGIGMVVLPRFEPETFLGAVQKYRLEHLTLVPPLVLFLAKHPIVDKFDLSSVKTIWSAGAPLGKEVERAVTKRMRALVLQGYGMTEFAGGVSHCNVTHTREGSTGLLLPNVAMKVKDLETDEDLSTNKTGELLFKTPSMMKGYYNDPEANRATFTSDGFIRTGDIGYIDQDGYVFIVDRLKELIKYKGHQVAPAELEDVLNHHPSVVASCCVRGFDAATGEEIPKAFVVLKEGEALTEEELMSFVASKVTGYKRVREVEFISEIPKSASGKVLRKGLQQLESKAIKTTKKLQSRL
ncbi:putative 4-coumarate--CoA ligase 1 [Phytophthora ramorum]|uniref:putative 4-coumarate--CoA ligase 1 n=1 Tax=Phytophthora ramorum TaxID=164328 RepID=UPI0030974D47|nr:putative 4-coumarate--CoA ligase 1 [Phytophthora ramorum]